MDCGSQFLSFLRASPFSLLGPVQHLIFLKTLRSDANLRGLGLLEPTEHPDPPNMDGVKEVQARAHVLLRELGLDPTCNDVPRCWGFLMITPYGRMFMDACTRGMT